MQLVAPVDRRMATVVVVFGNGSVESEHDRARRRRHRRPPRRGVGAPRRPAHRARPRAPSPEPLPSGDDVVDRLCAAALGGRAQPVERRARVRRRHVVDGIGVRRRRDRARRAAHARAAVRRRVAGRRPRRARPVGRHRRRARRRAAVGLLGRRRADRRRRRAARLGRRARPDPDELPAGDGDGRGRQRPARPPARRRADAMADFYELLGVARNASADEIKRAYRQQGARAAPRRQPRRRGAAERVQGGRPGLRGAVRPRPAGPLRPLRRGRASAARPAGRASTTSSAAAASTTCSTPSSAAQSPFGGGGRRGPAGPPRGQDMEVVADLAFEQAVFGATVPVTLQLPQRCADCGGTGRRRRHAAGDVRRLQRLAARCSGCARACSARWSPAAPCPRCGGLGQVVVTPCPTCRGEGRVTAEHTYQVDVPAGVDTGSTLRLVGPRARPGRAAARPATCTSTCASPSTSATGATATTS